MTPRSVVHHPTNRRRAVIAAAISIALAAIVAVLSPTSAVAAELGPGYQRPGYSLDHLGGYRTADGTIAYCIDIGEPSTVGAMTTDAGMTARVNGLDPAAMQRLNVVLSKHASTDDANTAAAVAMVVWSIADADAYRAAGGDSHFLLRAPESMRGVIQILADDFRAEASSFVSPAASISAHLEIAEAHDYAGSVELTVEPADETASVRLTNAVFADTGSTTRAEVASGHALPIRATPPATSDYRVSVAAVTDFDGGPSAMVHLFSTPGAQALVAAAPPTRITASAAATDVRDRRVPTVTTTAQPTGVVGGTVNDTATVTGVPVTGAELEWDGYLQPAGNTSAVCTDAERVFSSSTRITADGTYTSDEFVVRADHVGTVFWVATVTVDGTPPVSDSCGAAGEISTLVSAPALPVVSG